MIDDPKIKNPLTCTLSTNLVTNASSSQTGDEDSLSMAQSRNHFDYKNYFYNNNNRLSIPLSNEKRSKVHKERREAAVPLESKYGHNLDYYKTQYN